MKCMFSELRNKELICTATGERLGYADDAEIDMETGSIERLVVMGRARFMGLLGRDEDIVVKCEEIVKIGEDTVLVNGYEKKLLKCDKNTDVNLFE